MGIEWSSLQNFLGGICSSRGEGDNNQVFTSKCSSNCCVSNANVCVECDHHYSRSNMKHICQNCYYSSKELNRLSSTNEDFM